MDQREHREPDDVFLFADDQKFQISKQTLIEQSDVFRISFEGPYVESRMSELPQKDKSPADLELFVGLLKGEDCLTEENISNALVLARFYQASGITGICEKWMMEDIEKCKNEKFQLANEYNLQELKSVILNGMETIFDMEDILPVNLEEWSHDTVTLVLKKMFGFFGILQLDERPRVSDVEAELEVLQKQIDAIEKRMEENSAILARHQDSSPTL